MHFSKHEEMFCKERPGAKTTETMNLHAHENLCKSKLASACKFCDKWVSREFIEMHERLCKFRNNRMADQPQILCQFCYFWISPMDFSKHDALCKEKLGIVCKFCNKLRSIKFIKTHQEFCKGSNKKTTETMNPAEQEKPCKPKLGSELVGWGRVIFS